jgi:hypothetical protein
MLKYTSTYYALQQMSNDPWSGQERARAALNQLAGHMALCFRDYLYMASLGESRHAINKIGTGLDGFGGESREEIFSACTTYACSKANLERLISLFEMSGWGTGYGGNKWAALTRLVGQYGELSDTLFVDAVINAQHNGGTAFNKIEASTYMDIDFSGSVLSFLNSLLDYRRHARNYLKRAYENIYGAKLTLSCGRLALLYAAETGFLFDIKKFRPIEEGSYTPVEWGDEELPPLVKVEKNSDEDEDEDEDSYSYGKYEIKIRCPVCLQKMSPEFKVTECGMTIHIDCTHEHSQHCPPCHEKYTEVTKPKTKHCSICHRPLYIGGEGWYQKGADSVVHKFCYWLEPNKAFSNSEIIESKNLFDQIATLCAECGLPVLNGYGTYMDAEILHAHCYEKRELIDGVGKKMCDCEDCQTEQASWRKLFNDTQVQAVAEETNQEETASEEAEVHEYEVSAQGHCEIQPQIKESHDTVEFQPVTDYDASQFETRLADYLHATPALP